jgi:hypothetical protein
MKKTWQRTLHKSGQTQPVHSDRLERWLGKEKVEKISRDMKGWHGPPIHIIDVPGSVRVCADGDFIGPFERGYLYSAADAFQDHLKRAWRTASQPQYGYANAGFASISDAIFRMERHFYQQQTHFGKGGVSGTVGFSSSLHKIGTFPIAGIAASAAPGGIAQDDGNTGAMPLSNPASGTMHLLAADVSASVVHTTLLLYDRLFAVAKTMASTATEAVTGVPTRYQSTTAGADDYIGGNFGFVENGLTALAATAHNWTVCTYLDQANAASTMPSLTGNSGNITHRFDHPISQWFAPLESGDVGIKAWTQMQCSASVATGLINFVIGHPLGFMTFPYPDSLVPFDWITNRSLGPRIFDDAYLALIEPNRSTNSGTAYIGKLEIAVAAP